MASSVVCIICKKGNLENKKLIINPNIEHVKDLKAKVIERAELGEANLVSLAEHFKNISDFNDVVYHSECRKPLVNMKNMDMVRKRSLSCTTDSQSSGMVPKPPKRGRPPKSDVDARRCLRDREKHIPNMPKEAKCMFSSCVFCPKSSEDLHMAKTDSLGKKLLDVKLNTNNDSIRVAVADLSDVGDAAALEKHYHRACLRNAERSCQYSQENDECTHMRNVCDAEIVVYVRESLFHAGTVLTMNQINDVYVSMLIEKGIDVGKEANYKKYLKSLLADHVPGVEFIAPLNPSHSLKVTMKKSVSEAVEYATVTDVSILINMTQSLRTEILGAREWKFTGDFDTWKNPPLLEFILTQILYGSEARNISGQRESEAKKTVDVICQMVVQNARTPRQVKRKSSHGFKQVVQTPLSIGLPMAIHSRFRDYNLVSTLSRVYIGTEYRHVIDVEKCIESAVQDRMATTGGYCLPDFVRRDVPLWFAVDNIDFLENTAYGQNTLHGTLLVLFQRDEDGQHLNPPLKFPEKCPQKPREMKIKYREDPEIELSPIRFPFYSVGHGANNLGKYLRFMQTWALANFLGNSVSGVSETANDNGETDTKATVEISNEDVVINECSQTAATEAVYGDASCGGSDSVGNVQANNMQSPILEVKERSKKSERLKKEDVMPTWAATQHLLLRNHSGYEEPTKTNVEVVAPIFRTSPTDYGTLYTVLCMAQDISAVVIGSERRTLITLDMDLYQRAVQLQESVNNKNWVLRPGLLHLIFAALHGLGKAADGSGLDTIAVETGIYSSAALRGIYSGKKYRRGVEYHIMNALAILLLKLEAGIEEHNASALKDQCIELRKALHHRDQEMVVIYNDLENFYHENIKPNIPSNGQGLSLFLDNYVEQVEALLAVIAAARSRDWEACLAAIDQNIKYFAAFDLVNYFRMMPVHLAQMQQLKTTDPVTWDALKKGDFVVTKSMQAFCNLFTDQGLEQEIKALKRHGALPGITQDEAALDRFVTTAPHLVRLVQNFLAPFPQASIDEKTQSEHYQLSGDIGLRSSQNAIKLRDCILTHCQGNPYIVDTPLKNMVSSAIVPDPAKDDILKYPKLGQDRYEEFVSKRLLPTSELSVWDTVKHMKLKRFSNWMEKTKVKVGDKVIKLREDRELMGRCLIIGQVRPELLPKLEDTIGIYEMSVRPRSMFAPDGSLLLTTDKASLMHIIEEQASKPMPETSQSLPQTKTATLIIDAMCIVQALKKTPGMTKMEHLKMSFISIIEKHIIRGSYTEARVIFYQYLPDSLKEKTRAKRAAATDLSTHAEYEVHDEMSLQTIPLRSLLASSRTKAQLARYFAHGLLQEFSGNCNVRLIVTYDTTIAINEPHTLPEDFVSHGHEEADTQIPLHVLDCIKDCTFRHIVVESLDTDVFILLMDLVAHGHLGAATTLEFHTGRGRKFRKIDVVEHVNSVGREKSRGLIGLHNFTGADWGGKFVGISKKRWATEYLKLDSNDPIIDAFGEMGSLTHIETTLDNGNLPSGLQPLEHFVCRVYNSSGPRTLPKARWELFRTKNLESEMLPPTRGTLLPHIQRANFVCAVGKAYITTHPVLPGLDESGWEFPADSCIPYPKHCLDPPAPAAVLELIKCGCKSSGCTTRCSCRKNNLPCTPLCKCHNSGCSNSVKGDTDDEQSNCI